MTSKEAAAPPPDGAQADAAPSRRPLRGPPYRDFICSVVARRQARSYLEVGVHNGSTLSLIGCPAIGVDPNFVLDRNPVGAKTVLHLYQMTSDKFFRDHDPRAVFGCPVDVVFLDGLHQFEYLLRDFINAERICEPGSLIMLDDCLPINLEMTERQHRRELRKDQPLAGWWTGDVWKVVNILREYRPDLRLLPVDVQPTGNILITNLDPGSTVLRDAYLEIMDRYSGLELDAEGFETYWTVNAPRPAAELDGLELSRFLRS